MHVITKADAEIRPSENDNSEFGSFEVILSAPTKDRDGDTLKPDEWKMPLPEHITFDADHGMSVASTVGSGKPWLDDEGNLRVTGSYSSIPRAQEVRTLVNEGHIRTTSVAFMTEKDTKDGKASVVRELLNGAFVAVPSNRQALVLESKGSKAGARNNATDAESIQSIHDMATGLGAACSGKHVHDADKKETVDPDADDADKKPEESKADEPADSTAAADAAAVESAAKRLRISRYSRNIIEPERTS